MSSIFTKAATENMRKYGKAAIPGLTVAGAAGTAGLLATSTMTDNGVGQASGGLAAAGLAGFGAMKRMNRVFGGAGKNALGDTVNSSKSGAKEYMDHVKQNGIFNDKSWGL